MPNDAERDYELKCREFADTFPTANVKRGIVYAESGQVSWRQLHDLFRRSLGGALREVDRTSNPDVVRSEEDIQEEE